jgi:tetratricopeptide (TPR) repeat protein
MKCLEKDRNRRYETASAISMDLQRFLENEPVQACPPSPGYRLRKFVRRNKGPVLAAGLLMLALVGGMIGTTWGLIRAEQQHRIVQRQRNELAQRNQSLQAAHEHERLLNERARQAIEALTSESAIEQLTRQKELQPEQRELLEKMLQYYAEATHETATTEPERSREARTYDRLGRLNQFLGRFPESETAFRRAVALYQRLAADFPNRPEFRQELASSQNRLGRLLSENARLEDAEEAYRDGLSVARRLAADFPAEPEYRQVLAGFHNNLGNLLLGDSGRLIEAEGAHTQALAIRKQLVADFPDLPVLRRALAMSHNNLGWILQTTGKLPEAEASFRDAVAAQRLAAEIPDRPEFRLELASYQFHLGNLLRDRGRLKEAEEVYREALPLEKQLVADFPNRRDFLQELADGHNNVGHLLLQDAERRQEAEAAYREALAIKKQLVAEFPNIPEYRNDLAGTLFNLAQAASKGRDFAAARQLLDEAIGDHQEALQANPRNPDYRQYYRNSLAALTQCCAAQGDRLAALSAATKQRDAGWDPAADAYAAARLLVSCVPLVGNDSALDAAKRQGELDFYANQAIAMLRDAVAKGYRDAAHMKSDENLAPLRERDDFKKMVTDLEVPQAGRQQAADLLQSQAATSGHPPAALGEDRVARGKP